MYLIYLWRVENVAFSYFWCKVKLAAGPANQNPDALSVAVVQSKPFCSSRRRFCFSIFWKKRKRTALFPWHQKAGANKALSITHHRSAASTVLKPAVIRAKSALALFEIMLRSKQIKDDTYLNLRLPVWSLYIKHKPSTCLCWHVTKEYDIFVCTSPPDACGWQDANCSPFKYISFKLVTRVLSRCIYLIGQVIPLWWTAFYFFRIKSTIFILFFFFIYVALRK